MFFGRFGVWEIVAFVAVLLILFGTKRIPNLAKGLGEGIRNFRRELRGPSDTPSELGDDASTRVALSEDRSRYTDR